MTQKGESRGKRERGKTKTVADVMVADVVTVEPAASLTDAARIMDQENVGMLPVVDDGRVLGVITDRDIVVRAVARGADPSATNVHECLTSSVHLARSDWRGPRREAQPARSDAIAAPGDSDPSGGVAVELRGVTRISSSVSVSRSKAAASAVRWAGMPTALAPPDPSARSPRSARCRSRRRSCPP